MAEERQERLMVTRQEKIEYLVNRAYFNKVKDKWASAPKMFRDELMDQPDIVINVLYESAKSVDKSKDPYA